ncbi:MAG: hypothetical protein WC238_05925 [Parcubacteria group bacterium]|jgi:hypothetical protein
MRIDTPRLNVYLSRLLYPYNLSLKLEFFDREGEYKSSRLGKILNWRPEMVAREIQFNLLANLGLDFAGNITSHNGPMNGDQDHHFLLFLDVYEPIAEILEREGLCVF